MMMLLYYDEQFEVFGLRLFSVLQVWETPESTERRLIRRLTDFEWEITN